MALLGLKGCDGNLGTTQNFALGEICFSSNRASMSDLHISTFCLFVNIESVNVGPCARRCGSLASVDWKEASFWPRLSESKHVFCEVRVLASFSSLWCDHKIKKYHLALISSCSTRKFFNWPKFAAFATESYIAAGRVGDR
jgi:hypothetical protein